MVRSVDGTSIAVEQFGEGPAVVCVSGASADAALMRPVARAFGGSLAAFNYDRRGRGDSGDTLPYAIEREVEDLAAVIEVAGGRASVYGHSSGAGLAVHAAALGLEFEAIVLHEPPYVPAERAMMDEARAWGGRVRELLAEGRRGDAIGEFMEMTGMPAEMITAMRTSDDWSRWESLAPTLAYDSEIMGDVARGGTVPGSLIEAIDVRSLVVTGDQGPPFILDVARDIAEALPDGRLRVLEGEGHVVAPERLAPVVTDFLLAEAP